MMSRVINTRYKVIINAIIFAALLFAGCGINYKFKKAEKLLQNGKFIEAIDKYQSIIDKYPENSRISEVMFIIGRIYQQNIENDKEAKVYYKRVMNSFPETEWAKDARKAWLEIVDYFPLTKKSEWIEVDSDTLGRYMLANNRIIAVKDSVYQIERTLYTKGRYVQGFTKYYKKTKDGVYETNSKGIIIANVFLFPLEINKEWTIGKIRYTVLSKKEHVKVLAGEFNDCLKIKKQLIRSDSWSYEYYAPEIGKILTTQSSGFLEKRITELKKYDIPAENN